MTNFRIKSVCTLWLSTGKGCQAKSRAVAGAAFSQFANREHKRVIVVFRGSVVGGKDWQTNFNTWLTTLDTPKRLKHLGFNESIRVHQGFKSKSEKYFVAFGPTFCLTETFSVNKGYLFDETHETDTKRPKQKFDDVVDDLKRIYTQKEFASYELFITGHRYVLELIVCKLPYVHGIDFSRRSMSIA